MKRQSEVRSDLVYLTILILGATLIANPSIVGRRTESSTIVASVPDPGRQDIKTILIDSESDLQKQGTAFGGLAYHSFTQASATQGRSPDELRFVFDRPAAIRGVLISVDIPTSFFLAEFAVGIGNSPAYGSYRSANWLLHASFSSTAGNGGHIDEHIILPDGVEIGPDDFLGVGAWLGSGGIGGTVHEVFPEIIVYYEWIEDDG